ncbi:MAG: alginate export family protein [Acidobacteriia bacterium]|nr:alginate export family protein [Terriglobia bacterium]
MHILTRFRGFSLLALIALTTTQLPAQWWDLPATVGESLNKQSEGKWKIGFESRVRYETRTGNNFGKDPDISTGLVRTRVSLSYQPVSWFKVSGMMQDARSPWYGDNAPNTVRDPADLQESYFEIRPGSKTGFGMTAGRMMLNYGEARLIGSPQWSNLSRTYDHARAYYMFPWARFEFLVVSPVKIQIGEFNRPVLGDRVWGAYNAFPEIFGKNTLEAYVLRHDQNRPGGFTGGSTASGTDRLGVNTFGGRLFGPLSTQVSYNVELALQDGKVGPADHRAAALDSWIQRRWKLASKSFSALAEYKYASGTKNPQDTSHTSTFDQLYPANHDKFGHEDLFGWRNLHNYRGLATYGLTKAFSLNFMYDSLWLASARDSLYNSSGKSIAKSAAGTAGRHVGEETDLFATYKHKHWLVGAGYGHLFAGQFVRLTTPGVSPTYMYLFHTYSF